MNFIYKDVEKEILSFLINSRSMNNIFFINKRWNHLLKTSKFWKTFLILRENLLMLKEDNNSNTNDELIEKWEYYTKWLYPVSSFSLKVGDYVDVLDNVGVWGNGIIKKISFESVDIKNKSGVFYEKKFHIEFLGWDEFFNEIVSVKKIKPFGTKTLNNQEEKYLQIQKLDNFHWVFFKEDNDWIKIKIKYNSTTNNNYMFNVSNSLEILNKEEIQERIKPCTNAFSLLCNKRFINLDKRNLFI